MAFDPKSMFKSPVMTTAGGVVIGAGIFTFIQAFFELLIRPMFHLVFGDAVLMLNERRGVGLGCGGFIIAGFVLVVAVAAGLIVARLGNRE